MPTQRVWIIGARKIWLKEYWSGYRNIGEIIQCTSVGAGDQVFHEYGVLYSITTKIIRETGKS